MEEAKNLLTRHACFSHLFKSLRNGLLTGYF